MPDARTPSTASAPTDPLLGDGPEGPIGGAPASGAPLAGGAPASGAPLGSRVRRGVFWTASSRLAVQLVQFGTSIALARLLLPEDFGLVALVLTATGFAGIFVDLGLGAAIVQREEVDEQLLSTAFWLNAVLGVIIAGIVSAAAPAIAGFYGEPDLTWLLPIASLNFVLSLGVVQSGLLRRDLDFKRLGAVTVINTMVTGVTGISCAALGLGPLALVLASLAATVASTVQLWIYRPWRPTRRPTRSSALDLWRFSRGLLGFSTVNYWSRNADNLLVGKFIGVTALGFYGRAYNLMMMPVSQMSAVLSTVLFPALSRMQKDQTRFGRGWLVSTKASWVLGAPIGIGVAVTAPALVEVLYGERWLPMVPVLVLLAASVPPQLIGTNTGPVFQALGRTGLQFKLGLITSTLTVAAIVVALPHGIAGVAFALLVKSWTALWIPLVPALRLAGVRVVELLRALAWTGGSTVVMGVAAFSPRWFAADQPVAVILALQVALGATVYAGLFVLGERPFLRSLRGGGKRR